MRILAVLSIAMLLATAARAQDPDTLPPARGVPPPASSPGRVAPGGAFLRSLLIPGWGQSVTGRDVTGALFMAWEGITMIMTIKSDQQVAYLKRRGSGSVEAKRAERQDWLVLWIFNHFFAGAEAFVSAHLQDFPSDLQIRAIPGGVGFSLAFPW